MESLPLTLVFSALRIVPDPECFVGAISCRFIANSSIVQVKEQELLYPRENQVSA